MPLSGAPTHGRYSRIVGVTRVHDVRFVEFLHPGRVLGTLVLVAGILHVSLLHIGKIAM